MVSVGSIVSAQEPFSHSEEPLVALHRGSFGKLLSVVWFAYPQERSEALTWRLGGFTAKEKKAEQYQRAASEGQGFVDADWKHPPKRDAMPSDGL